MWKTVVKVELAILVDTLSSFPLVQLALSSCSAVTVCPTLVAINTAARHVVWKICWYLHAHLDTLWHCAPVMLCMYRKFHGVYGWCRYGKTRSWWYMSWDWIWWHWHSWTVWDKDWSWQQWYHWTSTWLQVKTVSVYYVWQTVYT